MSKNTTIIFIILACLLLAAANLALWATLNIFNAERFGLHVVEGLQSPEATTALAEPIVDRLMESYEELPAIARKPAEEVVIWMLQRPLFTPVFQGAAAGAIKVMTTSAQDVVGIEIAEVIDNAGSTVIGVISAVNTEAGVKAEDALGDAIATSQETGRLAIYEQGRFPKLRQASILAPWIGSLLGFGAIALYVFSFLRAQNSNSALNYIGMGIMTTALLGFLLGAPLVQLVAQNNIANPTMQIVVGAVSSVLVRSFAIQSLVVFCIGGIVLIYNRTKTNQQAPASTSPAT